MEVIGIIEQILDKSNPPLKKKVAIIQDAINDNSKWCVEFRKQLSETVSVLRSGDRVRITFYNDCRVDNHSNYYNNIVAEKIERI